MQTHVCRKVADAVAAEIQLGCNEGVFAPASFAPLARYRPVRDVSELSSLSVYVVPKSMEPSRADRASDHVVTTVQVVVQQRVDMGDQSGADGVLDLLQTIIEFLKVRAPSAVDGVVFMSWKSDPIYVPEDWDELQCVTAVAEVVYLAEIPDSEF